MVNHEEEAGQEGQKGDDFQSLGVGPEAVVETPVAVEMEEGGEGDVRSGEKGKVIAMDRC